MSCKNMYFEICSRKMKYLLVRFHLIYFPSTEKYYKIIFSGGLKREHRRKEASEAHQDWG